MSTQIQLEEVELHTIVYALAELRRRRAHAGQPVPPSVLALLDRLSLRQHRSVARPRQDLHGTAGQWSEWIGTRCAAAILDWSVRSVQRRHADLDGQLIAGRLMFPARAVRDYRESLDRKQNRSD